MGNVGFPGDEDQEPSQNSGANALMHLQGEESAKYFMTKDVSGLLG